MTPLQLREARRLLGWSPVRLAAISDTPAHVIEIFEREGRTVPQRTVSPQIDRVAANHLTLEAAGIEFLNGDAPGVRLQSEPAAD